MQYKITPKDAPDLAPHYHGPEAEDPVFRHTIARMFRSDFIEFFSKVHPVVPAMIFLPVVGLALRASTALPVYSIIAAVLGIYFQSHGIHHQYPDDFYRLLMVPPVSLPLAGLFYGLFTLALPAGWATAVFAGFVLGYLSYDYTHFAVHFMKPPRSVWLAPFTIWFKAARRRHMVHHFDSHERGYGVSTGFWDHVFGTWEDPGVVKVPRRMALPWLVDEAGEVRPEYRDRYVLVGPTSPTARLDALDRARAFASEPPVASAEAEVAAPA